MKDETDSMQDDAARDSLATELECLRELERLALVAAKKAGAVTAHDQMPGLQYEQVVEWLSRLAGER